ncbi:MAG: diguanylate cyclase [Planctomycetes bacterium]|nr:diguanylate cyclase [Planctomycetota bacterium]
MIHHRFEELKLSGSLPSPAGVGLSVLRLTQREESSMEELLWCLQADPALTGRLLKLANTARRPEEDPSTNVVSAARRLGMRQVRGVALGFTLMSSHRGGACSTFQYDRYWAQSLAVAVSARLLARSLRTLEPDDAFTLGLLARVGMLALAGVHPDAYGRILEEGADRPSHELCRAEQREFGIDHWEVTAAMLSDWGLPDVLCGSLLAAAHRESAHESMTSREASGTDSSGSLLELALAMADLLGLDREKDTAKFERTSAAALEIARRNGIEVDEFPRLCEIAARHWRDWCELVRLPCSDASGFHGIDVDDSSFPRCPSIPEEPNGEGVRADGALVRVQGPIRVLVVDDDEKLGRLVGLHLTRAGYQVTMATNGNDGLRMALTESPQIVVTDWMMPELNGLELCHALRRTDVGRKTYVLLLTAREDEDRIVDAFNAGVDDYVTKPFNPKILLARVQAAQRLVELQLQVDADKRIREQQVAEMGLLTRKLRSAALTDVLTELPNRRFAMSRLEEEWEVALLLRRPLSVVMVDIDHFKQINDRFGHAVGDHVLRETATTLREFTRRGDIVCRLGGEEFLVINVNSDAQGAMMCAERLRAAVEANTIEFETFHGRVTVSLGVAERTTEMRDIDSLLKAADQAVYVAKAAGRNACKLAGGNESQLRSA